MKTNKTEKENLMAKGFTENGATSIIEYRKYKLIYEYYDCYMGNFLIPESIFKGEIVLEALQFIKDRNIECSKPEDSWAITFYDCITEFDSGDEKAYCITEIDSL